MNRTSLKAALAVSMLVALISATSMPARAQRPAGRGLEQVNGRDVVSGEVLIKLREDAARLGAGADALDDLRSATDAETIQPLARGGIRRLRSRSLSAAELIRRLANHPRIAYVEPNYVVHALSDPNEPGFPQLWGLRNTGQAVNNGLPGRPGADIHAASAWDSTVGSTAQVVAVVDTGIDYTHPDLEANIWSAPTAFQVTIEGQTIVCGAGTHGFNAIARTCDPRDDQGHGTHVSGTIGAIGNNSLGVVGVNWIAQIMGIKFLDSGGSGTVADAIAGIEFAIQVKERFAPTQAANVRVLSNSWGGTEFSQALLDAINDASDSDMLFVAAAGNNSISNDLLPEYPASYDAPNIISVAATNNADQLAWFSNYSRSLVHLAAPGDDILSTYPGNAYRFLSGTSMAAPHVSGGAALILSRCALDTTALKDTLLSTAEPVASLAPYTITGARLDVASAVVACSAPPQPPASLTALGGDSRVMLSWSGGIGALSFDVKRGNAPGGPYAVIAANVKGKSYIDTAVVNDTTYYYVVSSRNTLGESIDSNEASATPKVESDLVVSAFSAPATTGPGAALSASISIRNQGAGISNPTTTRFLLSKNSVIDAIDVVLNGSQLVPSLTPSAISTAQVSIEIPADTVVGTYYLLAKADADNNEVETVETNNTSVRMITIGPDLGVVLTAPAVAAAGSAIVLSDNVKNTGGGAAGATTTRFYFSNDSKLDAADTLLSASRSVPGIAAGGANAGTTTVTVPSSATTGSFYVIAKADADNTVVEVLESNNVNAKQIFIGGDLVVSSMTAPATAGAGSAIVVSDTVTNAGGAQVGASTTRFFISTKSVLDEAAQPAAGGRDVPALAPGAVNTGSSNVVIPSSLPTGIYYLFASADGDDAIEETKETNNSASRVIAIGSDLVVGSLTAPSTAGPGSTIAVSETTTNRGAGAASPTTTRFYLSPNSTLDASDTLLNGSRAVPGLAAGASSSGSTNVTMPSGIASGVYYVIAKADADGALAETSEDNNTASRSVAIGGDLAVTALTVPSKGGSGLPIVVTDTTSNKGAGGVGESETRFYLSKNSTLDASDTPIAGGRDVPALAAGGASSGSTSLVLPSPLAVGSYYILAKADGDDAIAENQESNNTLAKVIAIGPDLVTSSVSVAYTITAGATVSVTDIAQNAGGEPSGATTTKYYLSASASFDASDLDLGVSRSVPALAAGQSSSGTSQVTIPADSVPGYYFLLAVADADDAVDEATETNNYGAKFIRIVAP
ncbi:MAG TPA: CARDB domain-containing protein [Vicinamibacterales bacterium]|nr:CARDB domain-containing protein [Vicinamibacterales bacterium]